MASLHHQGEKMRFRCLLSRCLVRERVGRAEEKRYLSLLFNPLYKPSYPLKGGRGIIYRGGTGVHTHARAGRPADSDTPRLASAFGLASGLFHEPKEKRGIGHRFRDQSIPQGRYTGSRSRDG
jgi:hypothetical protein